MKAIAPGRRGMRRRGRWLLQETVVFLSVTAAAGKRLRTRKSIRLFFYLHPFDDLQTREFFAFMLFQRAGNKFDVALQAGNDHIFQHVGAALCLLMAMANR